MSMGGRIRGKREAMGLTLARLAEALDVSFQAVSNWERDINLPDTQKLGDIAKALNTSIAYLMGEQGDFPDWDSEDRLFHENRMYTFIKAAATAKGLSQTLKALSFAREAHRGQVRKGKAGIPYISHPLTMACHALALGLDEDGLLAAILLHDVVEDCGVKLDDLPVDEMIRETVGLLSKDQSHELDEEGHDKKYFAAIAQHATASMVKLLDRCHNLSVMSSGFTRKRILEYIAHTKTFVLPLADELRKSNPEYSNACFLLKYQMQNLIQTTNSLITGETP